MHRATHSLSAAQGYADQGASAPRRVASRFIPSGRSCEAVFGRDALLTVARLLELDRRHVANRLEQPLAVEPCDPVQRRVLDAIDTLPGAKSMDHFGLVESVDAFRHRVVVRIALAADGRLEAGFRQSLRVANRKILHAPIAVMHQPLRIADRPIEQRLLQGVECQIAAQRVRYPPAYDHA